MASGRGGSRPTFHGETNQAVVFFPLHFADGKTEVGEVLRGRPARKWPRLEPAASDPGPALEGDTVGPVPRVRGQDTGRAAPSKVESRAEG